MNNENVNELDNAVNRAALLGDDALDKTRFDAFYARCAELPIAYLEEATKLHKQELRHIENGLIPSLMQDSGVVSITTLDGVNVKIVTEWNVSTAGKDKIELAKWLDSNGLGAILKRKHYVSENDIERLASEGIELFEETDCHTQTLKAVIKEFYNESGELPPENACKVDFFSHAKIVKSKE